MTERGEAGSMASQHNLTALLAAFALGLTPTLAAAESLNEALAHAYVTNPTLKAQRAALRATDEGVPRAKSGYRPTIQATGDTGVQRDNVELSAAAGGVGSVFADGKTRPTGYAFTLNQPVFRGLRTLNAVREAEANVRAGRETLRTVEQATLLDGVTAYMDVVRDQAIVRLRENNVKVLAEQLKATKDRFEVGEVTKTDVAQAEARLSGAKSDLSLARSNLQTSRAAYERVIGHPPSNVSDPPPIESLLPRSLDSALSIGDSENPTIASALFIEEAARYAVKQVKGELLPEVSFEAQYQRRYETSQSVESREESRYVGRVTVPLYQAGEVAARVRQAHQTVAQRKREIDEARVQTQADVVAGWGRLVAARAQIQSDQAQVRANTIALNGVREEEKVGQRTVLDVLDAEQELLDSQVDLVTSKRDKVVAEYTLLQAVGRLDSLNLNLSVARYDPTEHYRKVKHKFFGLRPGGGGGEYRKR